MSLEESTESNIERLFILALDGLESKLVKKYKLHRLKQKRYTEVDVSDFPLLTPTIWASFITGVSPEKHGIHSWWKATENEGLDSLLHKVKSKIPHQLRNKISVNLQNKIEKLPGITKRTPSKEDLQRKGLSTIFEYASSPIALFIPAYNEPTVIRNRYRQAIDKGVAAYENTLWKTHRQRVNAIFQNIDSNWDLFMVWLDIADQIAHTYVYNTPIGRIKFMSIYFHLNRLVKRIKEKLENNMLFMIVSDHGTDLSPGGHHSDHAFFSVNKEVEWKPESILDYAPFIKNVLKH